MKDALGGPDSTGGGTGAAGAPLRVPRMVRPRADNAIHCFSTAFIHTKWLFTLPQRGDVLVVKSNKLRPQLLGVSRYEEA